MALSNEQMHGIAGGGVGAVALGTLVVLLAMHWGKCQGGYAANTDGDPLEDMESIEASLAYKKTKKVNQPQKKQRTPDSTVKPDGVSRDENKPVDETKPKDDKKTSDKPEDFKFPDRRGSEDDEVNPNATTDVGEFNDNARGFAEVTTGDPFFQELAADFHEELSFPSLESASAGAGCLHMLPDGTIKKTKIDPKSDNDGLNGAIEKALKGVEKKRNAKPVPPPTHVLKQATTRWICFKIDNQQRQSE